MSVFEIVITVILGWFLIEIPISIIMLWRRTPCPRCRDRVFIRKWGGVQAGRFQCWQCERCMLWYGEKTTWFTTVRK